MADVKQQNTILRINTWEILKFSQESGEEVLHYFINVRPRKGIRVLLVFPRTLKV
jgi:hypothetical protein